MGRKRTFNVTEAELAVLRLLWERGPLPAKDVTAELYPQCRESDVGTVHSLLQRLEKKKCVKRDRSGRPHLFSAIVTEAQVAGQELRELAARITGGSMPALLSHLVTDDDLTDDDIAELRKLLNRRKKSRGD